MITYINYNKIFSTYLMLTYVELSHRLEKGIKCSATSEIKTYK